MNHLHIRAYNPLAILVTSKLYRLSSFFSLSLIVRTIWLRNFFNEKKKCFFSPSALEESQRAIVYLSNKAYPTHLAVESSQNICCGWCSSSDENGIGTGTHVHPVWLLWRLLVQSRVPSGTVQPVFLPGA